MHQQYVLWLLLMQKVTTLRAQTLDNWGCMQHNVTSCNALHQLSTNIQQLLHHATRMLIPGAWTVVKLTNIKKGLLKLPMIMLQNHCPFIPLWLHITNSNSRQYNKFWTVVLCVTTPQSRRWLPLFWRKVLPSWRWRHVRLYYQQTTYQTAWCHNSEHYNLSPHHNKNPEHKKKKLNPNILYTAEEYIWA
jgi:hypothetical protein